MSLLRVKKVSLLSRIGDSRLRTAPSNMFGGWLARSVGLSSIGVVIILVGTAGSGARAQHGLDSISLYSPTTFELTAQQAREVGVTIAFLDAFNAHRLRPALDALSGNAGVSDCDFGKKRAVYFVGRRAVTMWLRQRFADHDNVRVGRIFNQNANQPTGVVGVEYVRRMSDTLRRLGFPAGIVPKLVTKVLFTKQPRVMISRFANGPLGASDVLCRPHAP